MTVNYKNVSKRIFDLLTGTNRKFIMGDKDAKKTLDPNEAVRFFIEDLHSLIFIDDKNGEVNLNVSNQSDPDDIELLKNAVKNTAEHYMLKFSVKNFGKKLQPKNFAFMNVEHVDESFSPMSGTTRSSYQNTGSARLIIRHSKPVNEEIRGARSRSIKSIYIENASGERFQFPMRWLTGARSMARHIAEGGYPYDERGQMILGLCEQYASLRKFVRHANGQGFINEETSDLVEMANTRSEEILRAVRTNNFESIKYQPVKLSEDDDVSPITAKFTRHTVNQAVESAAPFLYSMIKEREQLESSQKALRDLVSLVDSSPKFDISDLDENDPDNPINLTFDDHDAKLKHLARYISDHLTNPEHKDVITTAAEHYGSMDVEGKNTFNSAIRNLIRKSKSVNTEHVETRSLDESVFDLVRGVSQKYSVKSVLTKQK